MGITAVDVAEIRKLNSIYKPSSILELGSQYLYDSEHNCSAAVNGNPVYGKSLFASLGIQHVSVDLNGQADLNFDITNNQHTSVYDWVTDFGTTEHTNDLYASFKNIHNWTKVNGLMIHENPETNSWPLHGNYFFSYDFYNNLSNILCYDIISLTRIPAMGNTKDGWNVYCVLKKSDKEFNISQESFYTGIYGK
jgi:hypothetical protein